jgi:YqjK-like protein
MNPRLLEIALKRQRLQLQAAQQRLELRRTLGEFAPLFAVVSTLRSGMAYFKQHPEWLVGAALMMAVARPRAVLRWLRRGFIAWQFARQVRRSLAESPLAQRSG